MALVGIRIDDLDLALFDIGELVRRIAGAGEEGARRIVHHGARRA